MIKIIKKVKNCLTSFYMLFYPLRTSKFLIDIKLNFILNHLNQFLLINQIFQINRIYWHKR